MERIVKFILCLCLLTCSPVMAAAEQMNLSTLITAQNVHFENCYKVFNTDNVSLFYLTIAAIDEIQSKSGYILFTAVNKQFLASISNVNTKQGMLRITPADNNYYFQPGIILNIFKYIELNLSKKPEYINLN